MSTFARLVVACSVAAALAPTAQAAPVTAQDCLAAQQRSAGTACRGIARCYAKAMRTGSALSPACLDKARATMGALFTEVEAAANCLVKGQAQGVADQLVMGLDDVATSLTLAGGRCAGGKMAGLGKACSGFFRCNAAADADSTTLDPSCIAVHAAKVTDGFTKLEGRGQCATTGDASTLEGKVANLVDAVHVVLRGTGTTTTSSTATTN